LSPPEFVVEPFGDRALVVRFRAQPSVELTSVLAGLARGAAGLEPVVDAWPGLTSVLIETARGGADRVRELVPELIAGVETAPGTLHTVEVAYDGEDLAWVCEHLGIPADTLIARHSEPVYDVRLLGSPGFVYLSEVPAEIAVPRLEEPRPLVAGGSVGIGGSQAGIYGRPRPGGWRIIGRAAEVPPVVPGDRVRFVPR